MSIMLSDDDDDAWSNSFPSSTDFLPLNDDVDHQIQGLIEDQSETKLIESYSPNHDSKLTAKAKRSKNDDEISSQFSVESTTTTSQVESKERKKDPLQALSTTSTSSLSSASLQAPFLGKSSPADPHTTREDANSIISKEGKANVLEDSLNQTNALAQSPQIFHDPLSKSMGSKTQLPTTLNEESQETPKISEDATLRGLSSITTPSPKIITYRKSRRTISSGSTISDSLLASPKEAFDPRLYVDEFYKGSIYRYATMKRNTEFHQLFRSLDLTDRLLDDFSCALSREILLQGRIYVSENVICFNSNLLGWVTNLVIPLKSIIKFEKKSTAGLFPNGISIETNDAKHNFASFLSRDSTFEFMKTVWQEQTGKTLETDTKPTERYTIDENGIVSDNNSNYPENSAKLESYILSIDEDNERSDDELDGADDKYTEEKTENLNTEVRTVSGKVLKFKKESNYKNMGPDFHSPTSIPKDYVEEDNEIELCDEIIEAPLGIVFDVLFGNSDTSFQIKFLESQNGSEISAIEKFHPMTSDPTKLERCFTYRKALGFSIGPKSTKCEVSEMIEHLNFADHSIVLSSTVTPDVPSGNSFAVKTRYCFSWAPNNFTRLRMSYFIEWTGRSWIKSVIEKQSLAGQNAATKTLLDYLKEEIESSTCYVNSDFITANEMPPTEKIIEVPQKIEEKKEISFVADRRSIDELIRKNIVGVCYFILSFLVILLILQLQIFRVINETNDLTKSQLVLNSQVIHSINNLLKGSAEASSSTKITSDDSPENESEMLWTWVENRHDKELRDSEKLEYLIYQISTLYSNDKSKKSCEGSVNVIKDMKNKIKDFNYQELLNITKIKEAVKEIL